MCSPFSSCAGSFKNCDNTDRDDMFFPIKSASKKSRKIRGWKSFSYSSRSISSSSTRSCSDRNIIGNKSTKKKKNPFADRGMDKFSMLLADLEAKKQKIYTQKGSQDISAVYFTYSSADELQPLIIKVKKQPPQPKPQPKPKPQQKPSFKIVEKPVREKEVVLIRKPPVDQEDDFSRSVADKKKVSQRYINPMAAKKLWRLMLVNYFPVTIIFILILLLFGGRSVAVLCLTVAWYLAPAVLSPKTTGPPPRTNGRKPVSRTATFK